MNMRKFSCIFLLMCASWQANAQLTVTTVTPAEAVAALVGPDLEVSNITYTGDVIQVGTYQNAGGNFPISNGVILCTSGVENFEPNGLGGEPLNGVMVEPDLLEIANSVPPLIGQTFTVDDVNDVAILEFDFVASGPILTFKYVFGSDEYLTWVNSTYNDVFAFFLSGPGITGPYAAPAAFPDGAQNIAGVPNSDPFLPITISSVNNVLNSEYYIDNPGNTVNNTVSCTGYTDSLRVYADMVCGETYHMKLAIADGSDASLKSLVVFEEGSFQTSGAGISAYAIDGPTGFDELVLIEGCLDGELRLEPPACAAEVLDVDLNYSGIAINGVDFAALPTTYSLQGETVIIPIETVADGIDNEGDETLNIDMYYINLEGQLDTLTTNIIIRDYIAPSVEMKPVYICNNDTVVAPNIIGGFPPYGYLWSDGLETPTHAFEVGDAGEYSITMSDWCGNTFSEDFSVVEPGPIFVAPTVYNCFGLQTEDLARAGAPPYTVVYNVDSLELIDYSFIAEYFGVYQVTFTDQCNSSGTSTIFVDQCDTKIPNVMTPNGDGKNDTFQISGIEGFRGSSLKVFDRWGKLVFEDDDYKNNWDGKDNADGTYFFIFTRSDGKVTTGHFDRIGGK
jgi:gliding motility-associated-like protein